MDFNMEDERLLSTRETAYEDAENSLRPKTMSDYIGQEKIKKNLEIFIQAAKKRGEALDHVLLYGPPGLGKTTLSHIIANEMGAQIRVTSGPAMEDYSLDIMIGKGPSARSVRLNLPPFTLIGATTKAGMLTSPLRDRFGVNLRLELYKPEELATIVTRSAAILETEIEKDASIEVARRSRGTPRIANRLLKRIRDFADVCTSDGVITYDIADEALNKMEIDKLGLDSIDRRLLNTIIDNFGGGPVGLDTLAASIGEDSNTIEDVYEPYLMQICFIARTPRGRVCLKGAYDHLNKKMPTGSIEQLRMEGIDG